MDEGQFNKELNKYRVVRRPEYVGPQLQKRTKKQQAQAATKPKTKAAVAAKSTNQVPAENIDYSSLSFWDYLVMYLKDKSLTQAEAEKLSAKAKEIFERNQEKKADSQEF